MIRIAIVDDHAMVRAGLRQLLTENVDLRVVAECANAGEAMTVACLATADVMLLDISMPDQSGIDALIEIKARAPALRVVVLSGFPAEHYASTLLRQGASGYLNKDCDPEDIVEAVRTVALGRRYIPLGVAQQLATDFIDDELRPRHEQLSDREFQVFLRLAKGETVGHVAHRTSLSVKTVSTYRTRVLEKMGLKSNSDMTYYAMKNGLLQ